MTSAPQPAPNWKASYLALTALLIRQRKVLKISQQNVAAQLGVGRRTFQRWEDGEIDPPGAALFQWASLLGITIAPDMAQSINRPPLGRWADAVSAADTSQLAAMIVANGGEEPDWKSVFLAWVEGQGLEGDQWLELLNTLLLFKIPSRRGAE